MKYHYVLTLQIPAIGIATRNDVVDLPPGTSRQAVFLRAREIAINGFAEAGELDPMDLVNRAVVVFWSLEAEEL
ncbi:hypothetical protein ACFY9H_33740 [Streptomyces bacillaris]|uniref:hypothetical protein n=1 Tax=Streptomyces bacillaris TaxID=68179 RepID=UPI0036E5470A